MVSGTEPEQGVGRGSNEQQGHEMDIFQTPHNPTAMTEVAPDAQARVESTKYIPLGPWRISLASPRLDAPLSSARDHLANERVFLAYFRTSSALATFAVVVLQLYRLGHTSPPPGVLSDYKIGVPLASTVLIMAILMMAFGAARFFGCQNSIVTSRIVSSGQITSLFTIMMVAVSFSARHTWFVS
ncbi:uncharacterized protein A1O9_10654 [Exophiala aquamarina CBS 119918]|uniref:DUF202 domain-containing protein n=1 Tax=Exophiala aquamarina CBS 119918 TaxID=1182545 RepID=A0A072P041_9EURO|nr:uncharacterized protein A1O9_10654 [Exophiala aquamarina CBS 119918]KEF53206.1 hypothetical protein A1O9_10654 [Exophiala aquamarina CBS 119918]